MLRLTYLFANLTRNPLRMILTCAAVAFPIAIYVLSMAVVDGFERFLNNSTRQLRLAITNKASVVTPLPVGHRRKIESLDPTKKRLISVCGIRWIGGRVEGHPQPLSTIAVDADTFPYTFPDYQLTPAELATWSRDRQALIVGSGTADHFGWRVGDRVTIQPSVPPYTPIEFHVISIAPEGVDPLTNVFRRDYLGAMMEERYGTSGDFVSFFFAKCATKEDVDYFRSAIDELFAGSQDPTKTQDEKVFMSELITQMFDLPSKLTVLAIATVLVAIMAAANTMSMNFRERSNELATMKSLGFGGAFVFGLLQIESLALCALSGAVGALVPYIAFTYTPLKGYPVPLIQYLKIHPAVCFEGFVIALLVGVIAAAWPSWMGLRLNVVAALRRLE